VAGTNVSERQWSARSSRGICRSVESRCCRPELIEVRARRRRVQGEVRRRGVSTSPWKVLRSYQCPDEGVISLAGADGNYDLVDVLVLVPAGVPL